MGRCVYCHSVVTRDEDSCYVCGDKVPKYATAAVKRAPVTALTNVVFLASLAFTGYCCFAEHKLSLPMTLATSPRSCSSRMARRGGRPGGRALGAEVASARIVGACA